MTDHIGLRELEEANAQASAEARARLAQSEECLELYRSGMRNVQERFYDFAAHYAVTDDPGFRSVLQQLTDVTDESVRRAARVIAEAEVDLATMEAQHSEERERLLRERRDLL